MTLPKINDFRGDYSTPEMVELIRGHSLQEIAEMMCWQLARVAHKEKRLAEQAERHERDRKLLVAGSKAALSWWRECELQQRAGRKMIRLERMDDVQ